MAQQYASQQPQGYRNHIEKVAIVGASGQVGKFITEELLKTGKHAVTAITRAEGNSPMPAGVRVEKVDYNDPATLVKALQGQEVLIITMGVTAPRDTQAKLIQAAADAGVPWVLPNEFGVDATNEQFGKDIMLGEAALGVRALIEQTGTSQWIGFACGFWYEYSLAGSTWRFGFDFPQRKLQFYDDGKTKINVSTWPLCGRAMASLLSLKVLPDDEADKSPTLSHFRNKTLYVASFRLNQEDMFESVQRVTHTKPEDWTISHVTSQSQFEEGKRQLAAGDRMGFGKLLYGRTFYPNGDGDYESKHGLYNDLLGLPKESLDESTSIAVEMAAKGAVY